LAGGQAAHREVVDNVLVATRRDPKAARRFLAAAIGVHGEPEVATTDRSPAFARAIVELLPDVAHDTTQYANNRVEADYARSKARLRPMRGLKRDRTAAVVIRGHAFIQNLRRNHDELGIHAQPKVIAAAAFDELMAVV
jgi:IS6 family transposase